MTCYRLSIACYMQARCINQDKHFAAYEAIDADLLRYTNNAAITAASQVKYTD
jgi:hypothetical protein